MLYWFIVYLITALALIFPSYAKEPQGDVFICMVSQNDDPIGSNLTYVFDKSSGHYEIHRIKPPFPNEVKGVSITLYNEQVEGWQFKFAIPVQTKLTLGKYKSAQSYPYQTANRAGIKVCRLDQDFKEIQGEFEILEYILNSDYKIASLAIDFEQIAGHKGKLRGSIRYNSSVPLPSFD